MVGGTLNRPYLLAMSPSSHQQSACWTTQLSKKERITRYGRYDMATTTGTQSRIHFNRFLQLNIARDDYRTEYLQKWAETANSTSSNEPIDVLICPVSSVQGTPHDVKPWWGYSSQWNLLNYPSGVIPAGRVLSTDMYPADYEPANDLDKENMDLCKLQVQYRGSDARQDLATAFIV